MSNIHEKLIKIQTELKVEKKRYNKFGDFNYRSCEDILDALKPYLKRSNLYLTVSDEVVNIGERYYIKAIATLTDGENSISTTAFAREPQTPKAKTDESQQTGATSSYARKYALNGLFCIDDTKDSDFSLKEGDRKSTQKENETEKIYNEIKESGEFITENEVKNFVMLQQKIGISDDEVKKMLKDKGYSFTGSRKEIFKNKYREANKALIAMKKEDA